MKLDNFNGSRSQLPNTTNIQKTIHNTMTRQLQRMEQRNIDLRTSIRLILDWDTRVFVLQAIHMDMYGSLLNPAINNIMNDNNN